jgi:hypothetical protein
MNDQPTGADIDALADSYRHLLTRMQDAAAEIAGQPFNLLQPPAPEHAFEHFATEMGYPLPPEVAALYRVTDGLHIFFYAIPTLQGGTIDLPTAHRHSRREYHEVVEDFHDRMWGDPPDGKILALSFQQGGLLFERTGPHYGRLSYLDYAMDFGYRPVAPSIHALLKLWADLAEAGLIEATIHPNGHFIYWDRERETESRAFIAAHHGHPAAVGIYHLTPEEMSQTSFTRQRCSAK